MSEYWKSAPKHYCEICKIWLSGHPRNVEAHNQSEAHNAKQGRLLQQMEINRRQKERDDAETVNTVRAIEAQATAAMKHGVTADPKTSLNYRLNRAARFAPPRLPPRSLLDDVVRPLEEDRIRKFIAKATGIDTANVASFIAPEDDFRKTMLFFPDEASVPAAIKSDPKYHTRKNWKETEDEATTLPLFVNKILNISIWDKPSVFDSPGIAEDQPAIAVAASDAREAFQSVKEASSQHGSDDETVHVAKRQKTQSGITKGLEAPVLGPWIPVQADESVFGDNVNIEVAAALQDIKSKTAEDRLTEFFETAGIRPDRTLQINDALDEADLTLVSPPTRSIATSSEIARDDTKKAQFKKRMRKKA